MNKFLVVASIFFLAFANFIGADDVATVGVSSDNISLDSQPRWDENLDLAKMIERLANEKVRSKIHISQYLKSQGKHIEFDGEVFLVILESGLKAVFKPSEDFDKYGEVAAFKACDVIGQRLVPPTVLRTIDKEEGSLQLFIESDVDLLQYENPKEIFDQIDPKIIADMKLFYFVFGQWDINHSNQIVQKNGDTYYLSLIDNAGMANVQQAQYGDFAYIRRGYSDKRNDSMDEPFPFDKPVKLNNPTFESLHTIFGEFLPTPVVRRLHRRFKKITCATWHNALWMQFYSDHPELKPNYTNVYNRSTIDAYKKLSRYDLEIIWAEGLKSDKSLTKQLIDLILERRDQVLKALPKGMLIDDAPTF